MSVDCRYSWHCSQSLSARRAWIEIHYEGNTSDTYPVALRKESVDRNFVLELAFLQLYEVALRKESVDRNLRMAAALRAK